MKNNLILFFMRGRKPMETQWKGNEIQEFFFP